MADLTVAFGSSYGSVGGGPPPKRKRMVFEELALSASKIEDRRVVASQALRLDCDTIIISVGKGDYIRTFKVHEDAICDRSGFFLNSMKPEWAEMRPDPRTVELPEDDPDAFALYRTWIYTGQLAILPSSTPSTAVTDPQDEPEDHFRTLAYAYVLGERLLDKPFKNAIADVYVLYARGVPPARRYYPSNEEVRILYDGTGSRSPIRRLLVDIWYCRGKIDWVPEEDEDLPREFLLGVVREFLRVKGESGSFEALSRPWKMTHEQYHDK